ncbi:kinase-like domain-containing protein [Ochromonadaceae sp. CCMP2298]|nr:kinase-like domain-containing protein [Ochromonadaceae sp. CCMP2298]
MESDLGRVIRSLQELTDQHLHYLLLQVLRGLKHVNSADELHRGLKPSALRVNAHCDLALYEFGLAVDLECLVPHWYCPPELLLECAACGKPVDVWSSPRCSPASPSSGHRLQARAAPAGPAALPPLAAQYTTVRTAGCTISGMQAPPPSPRCPSPAPTRKLFSCWLACCSSALRTYETMHLCTYAPMHLCTYAPMHRISAQEALAHSYLQAFLPTHKQMASPDHAVQPFHDLDKLESGIGGGGEGGGMTDL